MSAVESFLSDEQEYEVIQAIRRAERNTSGEIRVHLENNTEKTSLERAKEVFFYLKMDETKEKNGVLIYIGIKSKQIAIIGDVGVDNVVPKNFWESEVDLIKSYFAKKEYEEGLVLAIKKVGNKLQEFFPYQKDDLNELSDTISKG